MTTADLDSSTKVDGRLVRGAQTREKLLDAALELFGSRGFHATGMRDIAHGADIRPPSIYNHFGSKESVLAAALETGLREFHRYVVLPDDIGAPSAARLESLVRLHVAYQAENSSSVRAADRLLEFITAGELLTDTARQGIDELLKNYRILINRLIDDIRTTTITMLPSTEVCTAAVLSLCDRSATWHSTPVDIERTQDECWTLIAGMLGQRTTI
ncbi:TetR/AcrR family transcriptional regulator [Rhodococcus sp. IEGM1428]|uniref:TetR/AcrR family transcriptional regulator n=1 Tax=Rhodococcus sp. IEGM1428 TaxID=3392191 RepID=UPI003D0E51BE